METIYFDQLSRSWVYSSNGAKLPKTAYPAIGVEDKKWFELHVVRVVNSVVTPVDLSSLGIVSLHIAIDIDFNSDTAPMCRTNDPAYYDLTQLAGGIVGFELDGETTPFAEKVNGVKRKTAYMQVKGYDAEGERVLNLTPNWKSTDYSIICEGDIDPNTGELPGLPSNYSTTAEMNAMLAAYSKTYPPGDDPFTFTKADVDSGTKLLSVNHALGQKWGLAVSIDSENLGKRIRLDDIIPVDDNNLNIDCSNWYDDMTGNYHLKIRK